MFINRRKIKSFYSSLFLAITMLMAQNSAAVKGKVISSDEKAAENINVFIEGTRFGTLTDQNGSFLINHVPTGNQTLVISYPGMIRKKISIKIEENKTTILETIKLEEDIYQLQEIIVLAERRNQFAQKESEYIARLAIKNIANPQSYSVVSKELIKEQLITDITSSLKSITGGGTVQSNDGNASIYIRGFRSDAYVRNGMPSHDRLPVDPANIERIEVIKGPSSTLFGGNISNISAYGGIVNRVTKKPHDNSSTEVSYLSGSFGLNRLTVDMNRPLKDDNSVLLRINAAAHSEESFQDQGFQKNYLIAPSLRVKINEKLSFDFDAEFYNTNRTLTFARGIGPGVTANNYKDLKLDFNTSYLSNDMAATMSSFNFHAVINYQINSNWKSKTSFSTNAVEADADYMRLVLVNDTLATRNYIQFAPRHTGTKQIQQDFIGSHDFASFKNKLLVGFSYFNLYDEFQRALFRGPFIQIDEINLNRGKVPSLSSSRFDKFISDNAFTSNSVIGHNTTSIYFTNIISALDDKLNILLGGRYDQYEKDDIITDAVKANNGYDQSYFSPKLGLSFSPLKNRISVYANYMNAFKNNAPGFNEEGKLENWKPEEANQIEFGAKLELFEGKLISTLSYYQIDISNTLRKSSIDPAYRIQDGESRSKGFEFDIIANPVPGLNFVAGYTQNDYEYIKVSNPSIIGKRPSFSPETVANLWLSYRFLNGPLNGFGLGFGGNYVSKIYINPTNTFYVPAYQTVDLTAFYSHDNFRLGVKLDNIADEKYWNNYGIPQKPRSLSANISFKF